MTLNHQKLILMRVGGSQYVCHTTGRYMVRSTRITISTGWLLCKMDKHRQLSIMDAPAVFRLLVWVGIEIPSLFPNFNMGRKSLLNLMKDLAGILVPVCTEMYI